MTEYGVRAARLLEERRLEEAENEETEEGEGLEEMSDL